MQRKQPGALAAAAEQPAPPPGLSGAPAGQAHHRQAGRCAARDVRQPEAGDRTGPRTACGRHGSRQHRQHARQDLRPAQGLDHTGKLEEICLDDHCRGGLFRWPSNRFGRGGVPALAWQPRAGSYLPAEAAQAGRGARNGADGHRAGGQRWSTEHGSSGGAPGDRGAGRQASGWGARGPLFPARPCRFQPERETGVGAGTVGREHRKR
ncbi:hypothetical protein D3C87_1358100 [compost metagenome]